MPRQRIAMTAAEAAAFLAGKRRAIVGTRAPDGAPDGEPGALAHTDGELRFTVPCDGPSDRNLAHDARVVVSAEEFPSYAAIKGVTVLGRAARVAGDGAHVTFRVEAARVESFDFARMRR